jgi:hypothetical protein
MSLSISSKRIFMSVGPYGILLAMSLSSSRVRLVALPLPLDVCREIFCYTLREPLEAVFLSGARVLLVVVVLLNILF